MKTVGGVVFYSYSIQYHCFKKFKKSSNRWANGRQDGQTQSDGKSPSWTKAASKTLSKESIYQEVTVPRNGKSTYIYKISWAIMRKLGDCPLAKWQSLKGKKSRQSICMNHTHN